MKIRVLSRIVGEFLMVVCVAVAAFAEEPSRRAAAISERIAIQEARLPAIVEMAAQERKQTEQWYQDSRAEIMRDVARSWAGQLDLARQSLWVEFAKMEAGRPYAEGYFNGWFWGFPFSYKATVVRQAMIEEYFTDEMGLVMLSDAFQRKLEQIVDERFGTPLTPILRREARKLLTLVMRLRTELAVDLGSLENARTARLEATMRWERDLKEQVRSILEYLRREEAREPDYGVVQAIGYFPRSGYFCTIEGVDRVLGIGDKVGRVRVLNIDPEKVEFAGDGVKWVQKLGEPAQPHWRGIGLGNSQDVGVGERVSRMD
ncbi:MAG: hypothetical protein ACM3VT_21800 [Solirubrobacterales bacterium]